MRLLSLVAVALLWIGCGGHDISEDPLYDGGETPPIDSAPQPDFDAPPGQPDATPPTPDADVNRAQTFCDRYDTLCGYDALDGNRYDDETDCLTSFDGFDATRKDCVENQLDEYETDGMIQHCRVATGVGMCS